MSERALRGVIVVLGLVQIGQSIWMIASPGSFYDAIAGFGPENEHYIRDNATFGLAVGAALLIAAQRAAWRVPVLFITTAWYAAHAVNHLFDINEGDPEWVGPFDFAALALAAIALAALTWALATGRVPRR